MNDKRVVNEILKNYGKEIHKAHIDCVESHIEEHPALISRISYRYLMKRCVLVVLILVLTFSLLVIGANALGIKFLNLSFFEKETTTQVTNNENKDSDTGAFQSYEPAYIPKGYILENKKEREDESIIYVYKNEQGEYLYINQCKADIFSVQMDDENCDISTDTFLDMEVRIYNYNGDKQDSTYLLKKNATYIQIISVLPNDEIKEIVYNLK